MTFLRRQKKAMTFPKRCGFAVFMAVLLLWAAVAMALSPVPGTPIVNKAAVSFGDANGNPRPAVSHTISAPIAAAPKLVLEKTVDSNPVAAGATLTYTIRYENTGNAAATGVTIIDTLPAGVVFQSASASGVYSAVARTVTWNIGAVASGTGGYLTLVAQAQTGLATGTTITNRATASSAEGLSETAQVTTTVGTASNLVLTKTAAPIAVTPNGVITYTIEYQNIGNRDALNVQINDAIPSGTAYVAASASPVATLTGGALIWNIGAVAAGSRGEVTFQTRVSSLALTGSRITNMAGISSSEQVKSSNTVVSIVSSVSLMVVKMDTPDPVRAGTNLTYTIRVENMGAVPLTGVVINDPLPVGTTFVSANSGGVTSSGGRQADWNIGALGVGATMTVTLVVLTDKSLIQGQSIQNTATVSSNETPPQSVSAVSTISARTPGAVAFLDSAWQSVYGYKSGDTIRLQVTDPDQNVDPTVVETVTIVLTHPVTGDTETITLTETGVNTGIFRGFIVSNVTPTPIPNNGAISVTANSRLTATYTDALDASPVHNASALIDPNGVVFDTITGLPIAGTIVAIRNWSALTNSCDLTTWPVLPPGQINPALPTGADGKYAFPLVPAGDYCFEVTPSAGYAFPSAVPNAEMPAGFIVGVGSRGEKFTLSVGDPPLTLDIPLDPPVGRLTITKTANKSTAAIGDLIAYSLKVTNSGAAHVRNIVVTDVMPHGVQYLPGSSRLNGGSTADPAAKGGRTFSWSIPDLAAGQTAEIVYRAVVGPDSLRGDGVNAAYAAGVSLGRSIISSTVRVRVKITEGVFTEKGTIIGKIFLDRDGNRIQKQPDVQAGRKPSEPGIPGVALYLEDGTRVITDKSGKFSIVGVPPGTHVLRVDETTLPKNMILIPLSNRFMGDGASQFVDMRPGGLFKADFAVEWQGSGEPEIEETETPKEGKAPAQPPLAAPPLSSAAPPSVVAPSGAVSESKGAGIAPPQQPQQPQQQPGQRLAQTKTEEEVAVEAAIAASVKESAEGDETQLEAEEKALKTQSKAASPAGILQSAGTPSQGEESTGVPIIVQGAPTQKEESSGVPIIVQGSEASRQLEAVKTAPPGEGGEKSLKTGAKPGARNWEEEIQTMTPELAFLSPEDGTAVIRERIRIILKTPFGVEPSLSVNGRAVSGKQVGRRIACEKGGVIIFEYIDVHLNIGEANILKAEVRDAAGVPKGTKQITVTAAGTPDRIVISTDKAEVPADGTSLINVTVSFRDKKEKIVPFAGIATVTVTAGDIVEKDADPLLDDFQTGVKDGVSRFTLRAPRETGESAITVFVDGRQETAKVFFSPNLRDLFVVGIGEITIGRGTGSGTYGFLKDKTAFDDGFYTAGRGAFFLKGRIFGDYLLTAAYDSEKKKQDDLFRENDTKLDTEEKYPIYGDESKTGYEALSTDKLYVKLEKNRSYLLYGDYKTDLNDTKLAAYNRSFNGLKYELNTERFKIRSFGSYTSQSQVMDTLPGKGISGYYYLTRRPVIEGSERVVIEVRDRYRPDNVLSRESKARGSDYEIDYDYGNILFKDAIPSHDGNYNPVYVIASYESKDESDKFYIYGGRGAFQPFKWLEVGGTGVIEEKALGNYRLTGTDMTVTLPRKTIFKAEYAETKAIFEEESIFNWRSDNAWSFNLESKPLEKLSLTGYYRTLGGYFMNPSATETSRGTTKYGFDANYQLLTNTQLRGQFFDERDDLNAMKHQVGSVGIQSKFKKTKFNVDVSNESYNAGYVPVSTSRSPFDISQQSPNDLTAARAGIETELFKDLSLALSHKRNINSESYEMSQVGLNYRLNTLNRLYLREEYQKYQQRDETRTLLGVETELVKNTVAYNEYRLASGADGARNQDVIGLRNKFLLGKNITGNVTGEHLKTISGTQRTGEPDAVAGSVGLEYLPQEKVKATGRFERRQELVEGGRTSWLAETGVAYKLHPDYSLLFRERYFTEDTGVGGQHTTSRTMVGVAYRPLLENRFNALTKAEYKTEANDASLPTFREEAYIFSTEGVFQATPRLQLIGKYAGKLSRDTDFSVYTDLISGRFLYDLTDRWDVGAEYRVLTSYAVNSSYQGGAAEVGYRVIKNIWVSIGYSFDKFDADLAGDSYQGQGPYLKLRMKFDENTFKMFKKQKS